MVKEARSPSGSNARSDRTIQVVFAGIFPAVVSIVIASLSLTTLPSQHVALHDLITVTVTCGVAAMIIIETMKRLFPVRALFQAHEVKSWLNVGRSMSTDEEWATAQQLAWKQQQDDDAKRAAAFKTRPQSAQTGQGTPHRSNPPYLVTLQGLLRQPTTSISSVFNLPAEQMIAQLGSAIQTASDADEGRNAEQRISLDLDALHIRVAGRWRHYVRATAFWLSGGIALIGAHLDVAGMPHARILPVVALVFGGFVAWFARDISAGIERWRR